MTRSARRSDCRSTETSSPAIRTRANEGADRGSSCRPSAPSAESTPLAPRPRTATPLPLDSLRTPPARRTIVSRGPSLLIASPQLLRRQPRALGERRELRPRDRRVDESDADKRPEAAVASGHHVLAAHELGEAD